MDGNFQAQFDFMEQSPVLAVVSAVSTVETCEPTDLPPLAEAVDPETLNVLLTPSDGFSIDGCIEFTYCGYTVVVQTDGEITVSADHD